MSQLCLHDINLVELKYQRPTDTVCPVLGQWLMAGHSVQPIYLGDDQFWSQARNRPGSNSAASYFSLN